ncbi:MAG: sugar ABC transporter permease [Clostridiales bacterium]|nr:sugar ABC transporter permease [Clostridiales bacterium]
MRKKALRWTRDDTELTLLGLPAFIWYAVFAFLPMFGVIIAFKNYKVFPGHSFISSLIQSDWAGFKNFAFFIKNKNFSILLRNTLGYNIIFILLGIIIPVTFAILSNLIYSKAKSKFYQTFMFFPHFMSWVVASYFVYAFLSPDKGLMNTFLRSLGKDPVMWYSSPSYWPFILVIMNVWKTTGYSMVVYLASISGIDASLYEAAVIDGASIPQQVRYITLPSIKTVVVMMFILSVGRIFYSDFGLFYQITQGIPRSLFNVASTFDTFVYSALRGTDPIGRTAAVSILQSFACMITILLANFIVSKVDEDSALI